MLCGLTACHIASGEAPGPAAGGALSKKRARALAAQRAELARQGATAVTLMPLDARLLARVPFTDTFDTLVRARRQPARGAAAAEPATSTAAAAASHARSWSLPLLISPLSLSQ